MEGVKIRNDLFTPSNVKCVSVNSYAPTDHGQHKNFLNSLQNARNTLGCLERSIRKSNKYEQKLLHCKRSHSHSHDVNEWWESEPSEEMSFKYSNTTSTGTTSNTKSTRSQEDYTDSWSTMSIVCLQFQYEELAKRYKALMQAYNEQCTAIGLKDKRLEKWRERVNVTHAHLTHAHRTLISVGEKYLALKQKRNAQKSWYEEKLARMKKTLNEVVEMAIHARMRFDARLAYLMANERDSDAALLLYEIRKCNLLFLENMRLKGMIQDHVPGRVVFTE